MFLEDCFPATHTVPDDFIVIYVYYILSSFCCIFFLQIEHVVFLCKFEMYKVEHLSEVALCFS